MVDIYLHGSGERSGWVTAPAYSTEGFSPPPLTSILSNRSGAGQPGPFRGTPGEAIRAATLDSATCLANGQPIEFGAVRVGLKADLLLVEGDPTEDISRLQDIRQAIVGGIPIERRPVPTLEPPAAEEP